jgi:hypothetical protein
MDLKQIHACMLIRKATHQSHFELQKKFSPDLPLSAIEERVIDICKRNQVNGLVTIPILRIAYLALTDEVNAKRAIQRLRDRGFLKRPNPVGTAKQLALNPEWANG